MEKAIITVKVNSMGEIRDNICSYVIGKCKIMSFNTVFDDLTSQVAEAIVVGSER
jgi:hypothetical protein